MLPLARSPRPSGLSGVRSESALRRVLRVARNAAYDKATLHRRQEHFEQAVADARTVGDLRVHIGAGRATLPGWIDTDINWRCAAYLDLTQPWPVAEASVDLIYGDNVIEHLTLASGRTALQHAYAALAPGGIVRLSTPDVEASARSYLENGELARLGLERNRELGRDFAHPVQLLAEVYVGAKHYLGFCYDYAALADEMAAVGFTVRRCATGESEHPSLRGLELRTHPAERATQLCVEGVKPA